LPRLHSAIHSAFLDKILKELARKDKRRFYISKFFLRKGKIFLPHIHHKKAPQIFEELFIVNL